MAKVRSKDTKPEISLRKLLFSLGYRFRIHYRDLPGKPDIVFPKKKKIIFLHGCFWHLHSCKHLPKSREEYWKPKLFRNVEHDKVIESRLTDLGWDVLIVWECELKKKDYLITKLTTFLSNTAPM